MTNEKRESIISWLESNKENGFFDGEPEGNMDFRKLGDEDLEWYNENWRSADLEEMDYCDLSVEEIKEIIKGSNHKEEKTVKEFHDSGLIEIYIDMASFPYEFSESTSLELSTGKVVYFID